MAEQEKGKSLRSRAWFNSPENPDMTALYVERYLNYGLSLEELQSDRPIVGIAQTGSDLAPCNRHHLVLCQRVKDGIREAGGIPIEFPVHPIQETGKRPTAGLDRNLTYLSLVEVLYGYPLDGVVLTIGCDKTTPALLMAAATVNIPAIALSVGPMMNGWHENKRVGSGTIIWRAREMLARNEIDYHQFIRLVATSAPSTGFCNTMGTATTMNSIAEALGMSLTGSAAIPAPLRDRQQCAWETGRQIVEMVREDRKPSEIMTRSAFLNAIRVSTAIGGSTNAPIHLNAIARHMGVELSLEDWQEYGSNVPLLVNMQPAGEFLAEDFYRAGGVPAVMGELLRGGLLDGSALCANGKTIDENVRDARIQDVAVIRPLTDPLRASAGLIVMTGNFFDSAVMKFSVVTPEFRQEYLENPEDPEAFVCNAVVFDGPEDYHARIDDPGLKINRQTILVIRGVGPIGYPGGAEVVNMRPPAAMIRAGMNSLPCIGDGRQSGTSASPSILNVDPEAAAGGGIGLLRDGDRIRVDLRNRRVDVLISEEDLARRRQEANVAAIIPPSQTPWQEIHRAYVGQFGEGAVIRGADQYQRIADLRGLPRNSH